MNMWNVTVRGLLKPVIGGDEELVEDTCIQNQDSVTDWTSENIKLESDSELNLRWEKFLKRYILCLLHDGLNRLHAMLHRKSIHEINEIEWNQWLSQADFTVQTNNAKISIPDIGSIAGTSMSAIKSDIHVLPLSLEDNSTITGAASILDQFANDFQLSQKQEKHEHCHLIQETSHLLSNKPGNMANL